MTEEKAIGAAIRLQAILRMAAMKRRMAKEKDARLHAAIALQAHWRGAQARAAPAGGHDQRERAHVPPTPATFAISPPALALGGDEFAFPAVGDYDVAATSASGVSAVFRVTAKIVRRELRRLSDAERDAYLDAIRVLYATPDADGLRLYGDDFRSGDYFVRMHLKGAADRSCDHWHDDAGVVNHHAGITWLFEAALRSVDASTAAHYWDYTVDAADLGDAWPESFVFGDDWFGAPESETHVVSRGRFAFTAVRRNAAGYANTTNAFGLLRSPWNASPVPFLARSTSTLGLRGNGYGTFPTCAMFASVLRDGKLSTILRGANGQLHGPVHIMVGGHWGVDDAWKTYLASQKSNDYWLLLSKYLWRQGYVECPAACSDDAPRSACACACPALDAGDLDAATILVDSDVADLAPPQGQWLEKLRRETNFTEDDALRLLCAVGTPGELFTSAAPQDPLFWPLHGNAERFLAYARALAAAGELDLDETWAYDHARSPSETGAVCAWSGDGRPACAPGACPGHDRDDVLPFDGLPGGPLTNGGFYDLTRPGHPDLPYAYDSLASWPACAGDSLLDEATDDAWRSHGPNAG